MVGVQTKSLVVFLVMIEIFLQNLVQSRIQQKVFQNLVIFEIYLIRICKKHIQLIHTMIYFSRKLFPIQPYAENKLGAADPVQLLDKTGTRLEQDLDRTEPLGVRRGLGPDRSRTRLEPTVCPCPERAKRVWGFASSQYDRRSDRSWLD